MAAESHQEAHNQASNINDDAEYRAMISDAMGEALQCYVADVLQKAAEPAAQQETMVLSTSSLDPVADLV